MASLVLGILGIVVWFAGFVLAPLAIVLGVRAKKRIDASGRTLSGRGLATAGVVLGIVWLSFVPVVILSAVVFVLVSNVGEGGLDNVIIDDADVIEEGGSVSWGFVLYGRETQVEYTIDAGSSTVSAGFYHVEDANDPKPTSFDGYAEATGSSFRASAVLARGAYALFIACERGPCDVRYTVAVVDSPESDGARGSRSAAGVPTVCLHGAPGDAREPRTPWPEGTGTPASLAARAEGQSGRIPAAARGPAVSC